MYNSLWECDIIPQSFCWNVLQDYCWRRWWFWRSNSSMQSLYAPSCWVRFQNLCRNPRTNNNWTSSVVPILRNAFHNPEGENSRPQIGFNTFIQGSNKMRFQYCVNSQKFFRAIQGHVGWEFDGAWVDGSRRNSTEKERILVSSRMFV